MNPELMKKYDLQVPRYTSYPTAPHFTDEVNGATYRGWLESLPEDLPLSLYFHIPFCDEMCWFCGCYTKIVKRYEPVADYLSVLLDEVALAAEALPGKFRAQHLHWGGGSPTMLTGDDWLRTIDTLRDKFIVADDAEVAVEMDPRTATEDYIRALAQAGVTRASIGVQDFDPEVQQAINRIQPFDMTRRVIEWLRKYGITDINMDLMYGLPHQTTEKVIDMVDKSLELEVQRLALFGYAHVPWMKSHQKMIKDDDLPDAEARWDQFTSATARLVENGFVRIGLDHFARPDDPMCEAFKQNRLHRNFQGYTVDEAPVMLGFGASAIGNLPQGYVQNASPLKTYRETVTAGEFPVIRGFALSDDDQNRRLVIEQLMCSLATDLDQIDGGREAFIPELEKLAPLADDGIVTIDGGRITITDEGRPFLRLVAAAFDTYLKAGTTRHSRAV